MNFQCKFLRALPTTLIVGLFSITAAAQSDTSSTGDANSFYQKLYKPSDAHILYSYDHSTQTLSYSGNWDFDGDAKMDSLFFIGNGGAHLYYYLRLKLSSENKVRDLSFLLLDMPVLGTINDLKKSDKDPDLFPPFVVHDFNADGIDEIYLNFDIKFSPIPKVWQKKGVTSRCVVLKYANKQVVIRNYRK